MKQDVCNMLNRAAAYVSDRYGYAADLKQLARNLRELAERTANGDATASTEFLDLYCLTVDEKVNHG